MAINFYVLRSPLQAGEIDPGGAAGLAVVDAEHDAGVIRRGGVGSGQSHIVECAHRQRNIAVLHHRPSVIECNLQ